MHTSMKEQIVRGIADVFLMMWRSFVHNLRLICNCLSISPNAKGWREEGGVGAAGVCRTVDLKIVRRHNVVHTTNTVQGSFHIYYLRTFLTSKKKDPIDSSFVLYFLFSLSSIQEGGNNKPIHCWTKNKTTE